MPASNYFYTYVNKIAMRRVTVGCGVNPEGQAIYCPTSTVTREQMAAFIIRALGEFDPPVPATQRFSDVPPSNPFYAYIDRLAALGITAGCTPTTYCPSGLVTRGQMATFLERALGNPNPPPPASQRFSDVSSSHLFYAFIDSFAQRCINNGYSNDFAAIINQNCTPSTAGDYCPDAAIRRDDMAAFLVMGFDW